MKRYHIKIGFPRGVEQPRGVQPLFYTNHATARIRALNVLRMPSALDLSATPCVELTVDGNAVRGVYRVRHDAHNDLCLVITHDGHRVVTVWLNRRNDNHETLNRALYARP